MENNIYIYPAIFDYADDGISVEFPDLPGCLTCGFSDEEALYMAKDAMEGWLLFSSDCNEKIPTPTPLKNIKLEINQRAVLIDICLEKYQNENQLIKRTLTVPIWLNKIAEKEKINISQVLQNALKKQLNIMEN